MSKHRHKIETKFDGKRLHRVVLPSGEVGPWTISKSEAWRHFKYMKKIGAKIG